MDAKQILNVNPLLMDRVRLAIMATLVASDEPIDFKTLVENLELSKGNLSSHVRKLEEAGLVKIQKEFIDRKPRTTYISTKKGRGELKSYLATIEGLIGT